MAQVGFHGTVAAQNVETAPPLGFPDGVQPRTLL